jgi:hypothetical protein
MIQNPDMLHYTARFIDGLKPSVHMIVTVQRPLDLDTAYSIALVQEEVAEDDTDVVMVQFHRPLIHQGTQGNIHPNIWTNQDPQSQPKVSTLIVVPKGIDSSVAKSGAETTNASQRYSCMLSKKCWNYVILKQLNLVTMRLI